MYCLISDLHYVVNMQGMAKTYRCIRKQLDGQFISETGDAFEWTFVIKERRAAVAASSLPN